MLPSLSLAVLLARATAGKAPESPAAALATAAIPGCGELDRIDPEGAVIDRVEVRVGDVFDAEDPDQDRRLFRWVNRLHRKTRDEVIRRQLLFDPGDRYSRRLLDESERLLRGDAYLYDATIRPIRCHDGDRVDVEVGARDVWTLGGGVSFGHRGGESSTRFKVEDSNFLGSGKLVALEHGTTVDRSSSSLRYRDPALLGSRFGLGLAYADNSDGSSLSLDLERPFFALDSRWTAAASFLDEDRVDHLYDGGVIVNGFRHRESRWELRGGLSDGLRDGRAHRWTAGFTFARDAFSPDGGRPAVLPEDRTLAYPWIGFEHVEDAFVEESDLDQIGRTEDHFVGRSFAARVGFSSTAWGGDGDRAVFDARGQLGWRFGERQLLDLAGSASGRFGSSAENLRVEASARYYARDFGRHVFFAGLGVAWGEALDLDRPLYLGGEDGLRGYPLRYQTGDRRFLLTLEQRFMTDWDLFHLFRVGAAAFLDVGRAWAAGEPGSGSVLADVGVGLRLGHLRSGRGSVVHLDVAFPLTHDGSIDSVQWLVSTKRSF